jgi:predicted dehydrogenase
MKRIAILGCENSHADAFLNLIYNTEDYRDVEVVGVYSNEPEAVKKLNEKYGVKILENYTDAVGMIDALVVTARHGDLHLEYARPYIESGIPMFIDKPVTIKESEALELIGAMKAKGIPVVGGSSLKHDAGVKELKADRERATLGATLGGYVRAPIDMASVYGGFYFYAAHLVEVVSEIFGRYPLSVEAKSSTDVTRVKFNYENYSVDADFVEHNYVYYASLSADKAVKGMSLESTETNNWFKSEFDEFYALLSGGAMPYSYEDLISSVFVMNAIDRALASGNVEKVNGFAL